MDDNQTPIILYDSKTGNVKRFVNKLDLPFKSIQESPVINVPYFLVTYTFNFGKVPKSTEIFLENNWKNLLGISSSGNMNWGTNFAKAADIISEKYNVPIISKFELSGSEFDITYFKERMTDIGKHQSIPVLL